MKRILALAALLAWAAVPAHAQTSRFLGQWVNATPGAALPHVFIGSSSAVGAVTVQVWARCTPTPCDWGRQVGVIYSTSPSISPTTGAVAVTAVFPTASGRSTVVIRPVGTDRIEVTVFTQFTDNSGRFNFTYQSVLQRP